LYSAGRRSLPHRAGPQKRAFEEGAIAEGELAFGLEVTGFAAGVDVGVLLALVGPFAADLEVAGDWDAGAACDLGDGGFGAVATERGRL
jgi:hypothetical protein